MVCAKGCSLISVFAATEALRVAGLGGLSSRKLICLKWKGCRRKFRHGRSTYHLSPLPIYIFHFFQGPGQVFLPSWGLLSDHLICGGCCLFLNSWGLYCLSHSSGMYLVCTNEHSLGLAQGQGRYFKYIIPFNPWGQPCEVDAKIIPSLLMI